MRLRLFVRWCALSALLAACIHDSPTRRAAQAPAEASPPGLELVASTPPTRFNPGGDARLVAVRAEPAQVSVKVVASHGARESWPTSAQVGAREQALAVINGGYFDRQNHPLGLVIADGTKVNPLHKADWGVFYVRDGEPHLVHTRDFRGERGVTQALQCGPRLVTGGHPTKLKPSLSEPRSAVGLDEQGRIVFAAVSPGLPLSAFAALLAAPTSEGGLALTEALNLDGGPSTQLWAGGVKVPGAYGMPTHLVLTARAAR